MFFFVGFKGFFWFFVKGRVRGRFIRWFEIFKVELVFCKGKSGETRRVGK